MRRILLTLILTTLLAAPALAVEFVTLQTNFGTIVLELDDKKAPISVANFLSYVDEGFYNQTVFHRVIPKFMIQSNYANRSDDVLSSLGAEFIDFIQQERESYIQFIPQVIITVAKYQSQRQQVIDPAVSMLACIYELQSILNGV